MSYPWMIETLREFELITDEQANKALDRFEAEWNQGWEDAEWWHRVADIAWENDAPWWRKLLWAGIAPMSWKVPWIRARRGW
jgi:hypothetical protein